MGFQIILNFFIFRHSTNRYFSLLIIRYFSLLWRISEIWDFAYNVGNSVHCLLAIAVTIIPSRGYSVVIDFSIVCRQQKISTSWVRISILCGVWLCLTTIRYFIRISNKIKLNAEVMELTAIEVIKHNGRLWEVARIYEVSKSTFISRQKYKLSGETDFKYEANNATKNGFTIEQERKLLSYILKTAQWNFGMTVDEMKKLAFKHAEANNLKYPPSGA